MSLNPDAHVGLPSTPAPPFFFLSFLTSLEQFPIVKTVKQAKKEMCKAKVRNIHAMLRYM